MADDRPATVWSVVQCTQCDALIVAKCDACQDALLIGHPMVCREGSRPGAGGCRVTTHTHLHIMCTGVRIEPL